LSPPRSAFGATPTAPQGPLRGLGVAPGSPANPAPRRLLGRAALAALCLVATVSVAQEKNHAVMAEGQATEASILEALLPPTTRQFKPGQRPPPAKASLLITFVTASADLTDGAKGMLDVLAGALKNERLNSKAFTIEGHADPRGSAALNQSLSLARAQSVRAYLLERHGLDSARLQARGRGSSEPLNRANPAAPENRRVTIVAQPR
jgi:OmpA-OmpF porin, OOP family